MASKQNKVKSQKDHIKEWLEDGLEIDYFTALEKFKCRSLAQRIDDLRSEGMKIETTIIYQGNSKYASYKLIKENSAN